MKTFLFALSVLLSVQSMAQKDFNGYFDFSYDESTGKITLDLDGKLDKEFLYVNSIAAGAGSNDLGFDRGKLGSNRIVKFIRSGNKILLLQPNQKYRANSDNQLEVRAVEQAFAQSILASFPIIQKKNGKGIEIDLTPFLLSDTNGLGRQLRGANQGSYKLDTKRSALFMEGTFAFPKNVEFEAYLTFTGEAKGRYIRSVAPSAEAVTMRQHISFIELPDDNYRPRAFHPYSGYFNTNYYDYATPIHQPINKKFIVRHRLNKKNPNAAMSEAVEPIVYYLDSGCPEPVKSALLDGAKWWNQAFEAAGYKNAFQVKVLPADAHPLDVRYNVIQWVHRSTRGWSYGASVSDPRTGEIIKGHVSLGSLRVRQDFMIAQGLLSPYEKDSDNHKKLMEMALARLRQLSAHEIGHTIGLSHNFASSVNDRASVMDYPHPLITMGAGKQLDFSDAYAVGIGEWDKRTIMYGYSDIPADQEDKKLHEILSESKDMGFLYITDADARPAGSAHPKAHLWDNGKNAIDELERLLPIRQDALARMGENTITKGTPYSELEKVLVPVYLMHRYQTEAASKSIGGVDYNYAVRGLDNALNKVVPQAEQSRARKALLKTLTPEYLAIPEPVKKLLLPAAQGYGRDRETFSGNTGLTFDPMGAAEAYSNFTIGFMMNGQRLARLVEQGYLKEHLSEMSTALLGNGTDQLAQVPLKVYVVHLIKAANSKNMDMQAKALVQSELASLKTKLSKSTSNAGYQYLKKLIDGMSDENALKELPSLADMPPGSPIGCE